MKYHAMLAYLERRPMLNCARRPHWHAHSYIYHDRRDGFTSHHQPYWPVDNHSRRSAYVRGAGDMEADDWIEYAAPSDLEKTKALRAALQRMQAGCDDDTLKAL